ncbi:MAG: hypothetical protein JW929_00450 [Anaerolineales bacterium]|nr:hypothetical protein [Anaerolineales bacterium]
MKSNTGEPVSGLAVTIAKKIFRLFSPGSGLPQLLRCPFVDGGIDDGDMDNSAPYKFHNDKDVEGPKQPVVYGREIARPNITGMIPDESAPIVVRIWDLPHSMDVFLNGSFTQCDAQFEEPTPDPLGAPKTIFPNHLSKNADGFWRYSRFLPPIPGYMPPEKTKEIAMPAEERIRLNNVKSLVPGLGAASQKNKAIRSLWVSRGRFTNRWRTITW